MPCRPSAHRTAHLNLFLSYTPGQFQQQRRGLPSGRRCSAPPSGGLLRRQFDRLAVCGASTDIQCYSESHAISTCISAPHSEFSQSCRRVGLTCSPPPGCFCRLVVKGAHARTAQQRRDALFGISRRAGTLWRDAAGAIRVWLRRSCLIYTPLLARARSRRLSTMRRRRRASRCRSTLRRLVGRGEVTPCCCC